MGNADLRELAALNTVHPTTLDGQVVAIDAHNWLYRYITGMVRWMDERTYTTTDGEEVPNLVGILRGLPTLLDTGLIPVFVFDGAPDDLKADEIERRRDARESAQNQLSSARNTGDSETVRRMKARTQRLTSAIHESTRTAFDMLDIPYVEAAGAGEAQTAHYAATGGVDLALTEDYDSLLFGCPVTVRKFSSGDEAEMMLFQETLETHDITHRQLVDIAMLCGTDYNDGIHGVGVKTGLKGVKKHGSADAFLEHRGDTIENIDEIRSLFLNPPVSDELDVTVPSHVDEINPDFIAFEEYLCTRWELPEDRVQSGIDRLKKSTEQRWF